MEKIIIIFFNLRVKITAELITGKITDSCRVFEMKHKMLAELEKLLIYLAHWLNQSLMMPVNWHLRWIWPIYF